MLVADPVRTGRRRFVGIELGLQGHDRQIVQIPQQVLNPGVACFRRAYDDDSHDVWLAPIRGRFTIEKR